MERHDGYTALFRGLQNARAHEPRESIWDEFIRLVGRADLRLGDANECVYVPDYPETALTVRIALAFFAPESGDRERILHRVKYLIEQYGLGDAFFTDGASDGAEFQAFNIASDR